ncbi:hypothetical protein SVEN_6547 [Streptomyces venezuelae ATCC 10712]|uniref:Uncharacterized protein n=1 Tax=Streptomyces venezuelae (strain ATCC 10712 / CBS 650.69 / DSM 40230 / JCM 4526 / NBRC 13096 / PD 04745) TaxID=953739 RepID=F2RGB3_STRVP|nr:hypothetical protein DEJ43_32815 [Streptomyces venezuelae ATCC 10712]CCA59833.1 hypothetical protein SVEN_6547 [Streptomyces venezuelae ATCC 10712]
MKHSSPSCFVAQRRMSLRLRKIAGHGSPTTTQRYRHPDAGQKSAAGAAFAAQPVTAVTAVWPQRPPWSPAGPQKRSRGRFRLL